MRKILFVFSMFLFVATLAACETLETTAVGFAAETLTLEVGDSASLVLDNPRAIELAALTFESENTDVVSVTSTGGVIAEGEGITAITLTYQEVIVDFILVNVFDPDSVAVDGREVVMRVANNYVQWAYEGSDSWNDLISLFALTGADGADGADGQDGADGSDGKDGSDGADGTNGIDGREVEFNVSDTYMQWRYVGETTWNDLAPLSLFKGEPGVSVVDAYFSCGEGSLSSAFDEGAFLSQYNDSELFDESDVITFTSNDYFDNDRYTIPAGSTDVFISFEGIASNDFDFDIDYAYWDFEDGFFGADEGEFDTVVINDGIQEYIIPDPYAEQYGYQVLYSGWGTDDEGGNPYGFEYFYISGTTTHDITFGVVYFDDEGEVVDGPIVGDPVDVEVNVKYNASQYASGSAPGDCTTSGVSFDNALLMHIAQPGFYFDYSFTLMAEFEDLDLDLVVATKDEIIFEGSSIYLEGTLTTYGFGTGDYEFTNDDYISDNFPWPASNGWFRLMEAELTEPLYFYVVDPVGYSDESFGFEIYDESENVELSWEVFNTDDLGPIGNVYAPYAEFIGVSYLLADVIEPGYYDQDWTMETQVNDLFEVYFDNGEVDYSLVLATADDIIFYETSNNEYSLNSLGIGDGWIDTYNAEIDDFLQEGFEAFYIDGDLYETLYVYIVNESDVPGTEVELTTRDFDNERDSTNYFDYVEFVFGRAKPQNYMNFVLSDESIISINFTEMFTQSAEYQDLIDYIDTTDERLQGLIDASGLYDLFLGFMDFNDFYNDLLYQHAL
jgi:hypothetical protein